MHYFILFPTVGWPMTSALAANLAYLYTLPLCTFFSFLYYNVVIQSTLLQHCDIKDYNGLYTIYLTKLYKVLVRVIIRVIIIFNFYIYKELFGLISFTFKIFYTFILNQEALEISYSDFLVPNILYTLVKFIICLFLSV